MAISICPCSFTADFSQVTGETILPFVFTLDTINSVLNPAVGVNQRFCYRIVGVGEDTSEFTDLSHFVIGICTEIIAAQITNISVAIDGVEQEVVFGEGGNVELRTEDNPDPQTGCAGLKFDFPLDKDGGVLYFCFELTEAFPVGPIGLCLFGGDVTAVGPTICGPACACEQPDICPVEGFQQLDVCVPVTVTPAVDVGDITVTCCGAATISTEPCADFTETSCIFYVTQPLCVAVPLIFSANAVPGDALTACNAVSLTGCDCPTEE